MDVEEAVRVSFQVNTHLEAISKIILECKSPQQVDFAKALVVQWLDGPIKTSHKSQKEKTKAVRTSKSKIKNDNNVVKIDGPSIEGFCGDTECKCKYSFNDRKNPNGGMMLDPARKNQKIIHHDTIFFSAKKQDLSSVLKFDESIQAFLQSKELVPESVSIGPERDDSVSCFIKMNNHQDAIVVLDHLSDSGEDADHPSEAMLAIGTDMIVNFAVHNFRKRFNNKRQDK
jgi:hypothetical protein